MRDGLLRPSINDPQPPAAQPKRRERLQCLDAVRGLNVIVMMFVGKYRPLRPAGLARQRLPRCLRPLMPLQPARCRCPLPARFSRHAGWSKAAAVCSADCAGDVDEYWIDHSPWNGIHLADFVMPLFLFMVGVSMAFSMKKYAGPGLKWKVASRTAKLFVLGCLTQGADIFQGGVGIDMENMRIPGILQRIAWAYAVVSMMKMWLPVYTTRGFVAPWKAGWDDAPDSRWKIFVHYSLHWVVAFSFFFLYVLVMLFVTVPSWTFTKPGKYEDADCSTEQRNGTRLQVCTSEWRPEQSYHTVCDTHGDLTPKCSALRMVDMWLLGPEHM